MSTEDPGLLTSSATGTFRTPGQIRQQLKQVMFRHLQKSLRANFKKYPESCIHNRRETLMGTDEQVGVCRHSGTPRGKVCDSRVFGCLNMASACKWWEPIHSKGEIKSEFRSLMTGNRGRIASVYPDIAALMWVLDGEDLGEELRSVEEQADQIQESAHPASPEDLHE